ncbi:hypothetical protein GCM10027275_42210 [Rhabdobacter roseus]
MVFTEIVADKIWGVDLQTTEKKVNAAVNKNTIISSYRLAADLPPDSLVNLLNPSVIKGGSFSNYREEEYSWYREGNYGQRLVADYNWQGKTHRFQWGITMLSGQATYTLEMLSAKSRVTSLAEEDMPNPIRNYLSQKGLGFSTGTIFKNDQDENMYQVMVSQNNTFFTLLFNNQHTLIGGSEQPTLLNGVQALPESIRHYLANTPEYKDFVFEGQFARNYKRTYDGVTSYDLCIQKNTGTMYGTQVWFITLDQAGNVLVRSYMGFY